MHNMTTKNLDLGRPVSKGQAFSLARAYMLGGKTEERPLGGFASFVPSWTPGIDTEDPGERAAMFLTAAGADFGSASDALEFLGNSRPTTPEGKAFRGIKALATLLKQKIPVAPASYVATPKVAAAKAPAGPGVSKNQLELLKLQIRELELRLALARVEGVAK